MAYALRGSVGRQVDHLRHSQPGGWWKFGLIAVTATVMGIVFVRETWDQSTAALPTLPQAMVIEVAPQPQAPASDGFLAVPNIANAPAIPRPIAQPPTGAELDTPATVKSAQTEVAPRTDTAPVEVPPPVAPAQTAPAGLHSLNLGSLTSVQNLARQLNGSVDSAAVQYADLTGDGVDEAIVPITSGGTLGDMGFVVLMQGQTTPQPILVKTAGRDSRGVVVSLDNRQLTSTSAIYGPADAECCPSQIVRTYYRWDGQAMVVDHENTISVPQGKSAD